MKYAFKKDDTTGKIYDHICHIYTPTEAKEFFEAVVDRQMTAWGKSRSEAENIERQNIFTWARYMGTEIVARMNVLFSAEHPVF